MAVIEVPYVGLGTEELLERLPERGNVRFGEIVDEDEDHLRTRRSLDELVLEGEVKRYPVGEHIMLRREEGEPG